VDGRRETSTAVMKYIIDELVLMGEKERDNGTVNRKYTQRIGDGRLDENAQQNGYGRQNDRRVGRTPG